MDEFSSVDPTRIRNICIIAHVDHGKTTLSDTLLAQAGVISSRTAGEIRYLDSRIDEQERGITMKSSSIALKYKISDDSAEDGISLQDYVIHLIDSPGHIDFSGEVSAASRLADGAFLLVDVVEGICSQTRSVLRQALREKVSPVLVFNKIDRLILELKKTPLEIYNILLELLNKVNGLIDTLHMELGLLELESEHFEFFDPNLRHNVIFASSVDGWAFRPHQFSKLFSKKLGLNDESAMTRSLWGEFYIDSKNKKVVGKVEANERGLVKPLFVTCIIDNICRVYEASMRTGDRTAVEKIVQVLGIKILPRELKSKDGKLVVKSIMKQWLPLASCLLYTAVQVLPSPIVAQKHRFEYSFRRTSLNDDRLMKTRDAIKSCRQDEPTVVYITKLISVSPSNITNFQCDVGDQEEVLVGVGRILCGTLRNGSSLFVLDPKYDPLAKRDDGLLPKEITMSGVFIMRGKDLIGVEAVKAGHIVGVAGLASHVLKTATLSSTLDCPSFDLASNHVAAPILRVAVEPEDPADISKLERGLKLLNQADPMVEIRIQETGENILATAGELHLEMCLKDLSERFAKVKIHSSPPIVPFRETISSTMVSSSESSSTEPMSEVVEVDDESFKLSLRAKAIEPEISLFLAKHMESLSAVLTDGTISDLSTRDESKDIWRKFRDLCKSSNEIDCDRIICMGPVKEPVNLLILGNSVGELDSTVVSSLVSGFQTCVSRGPLCGEPLMNVSFTVERVSETISPEIAGKIIPNIRDCLYEAFSRWSPRLMLAMYLCDIQCTADVVGKVYSVISKRKGKVISENMKDDSEYFIIQALIPAVESFGFCDEIRKKTSGLAYPQLVFQGYDMLDQDPFWVPTTREELEDLGEKSDKENIAKKYLDDVRKRKGLFVEKKIVDFAEKQRTLKK